MGNDRQSCCSGRGKDKPWRGEAGEMCTVTPPQGRPGLGVPWAKGGYLVADVFSREQYYCILKAYQLFGLASRVGEKDVAGN